MVLGLLLAAGAVGLAGYGVGKQRERREVANGYITYHDDGHTTPHYGNLHYGSSGRQHGGRHHGAQHTTYPSSTGYY